MGVCKLARALEREQDGKNTLSQDLGLQIVQGMCASPSALFSSGSGSERPGDTGEHLSFAGGVGSMSRGRYCSGMRRVSQVAKDSIRLKGKMVEVFSLKLK